jgi:photosystem II stability/assembly factor-like uncharacterized protein
MRTFAPFAVTLLVATASHANSRLPATNQLVIAPDAPQTMLLRATFGFLFTHDGGATWDWLCESAIPLAGQQDPAVTLLAGGVVLSAQMDGLMSSPDVGCSWAPVSGTSKQVFVDVTRTPNGTSGYAIENLYTMATDAGALVFATSVWQSTDSGHTWQTLSGAIDPTLVIDTLDVAPSDASRIYVTGEVIGADHASMLVSKDAGQSYAEYPIAFATNESGAFISGVDPTNADVVYVRTLAADPKLGTETSRLLVSTDGGQTFTEKWSGGKLLGFALSADGARVYVGTAAGLETASTTDFAFTQRSTVSIACLTMAGSTLYACSDEASSGFILGSSTDEGASFTPLLKLETIHGPLSCPHDSPAAQCTGQWPAFAEQLGIDAGAPSPVTPPPSASGGCQTAPTSSALWLVPLALTVLVRLRSTRRASHRGRRL